MSHPLRSVLALATFVSHLGLAQARVVSAPPEPSLLNITGQWSGASILGDLRELRTGSDYRELRVWGGYTLTSGTQGVILRRANGQWSAFLARVMQCEIQIPRVVGETASRATIQRYSAEARRQCGTKVDVGPGTQVITTDSLFVAALSVPESTIEAAWTAAERAGVFQLPPRIERNRTMDDVFMYVVELRSGGDYRASTIEHMTQPEIPADQQVKDIYAAVNRVLKDEQILKP
ncbi:MAG TPA: hypothetical protein VJN70_09290 [Gemmatimonadaceae bacterium]|nr:hypothetical protein [Gemmatimonadaceae bacterium]